jgi:membrane-bound lytic murein transglycosylase D
MEKPLLMMHLKYTTAVCGLVLMLGLGNALAQNPAAPEAVASAANGTAPETPKASTTPQAPQSPQPPQPPLPPQAPLDAPASIAAEPDLTPTPRGRLDRSDDAVRADLWQRIRNGFVLPDLSGELVQKWEQYYAGKPDYVQRMTERGGRYLFHITEEVQKRGLPLELALLPFTESAFNPQAMSSARASGMWQFMPATGKDFALRQNLFRDDRRNVLASTRAALDYLQRLHNQFGDWQLALAAYNWGQGNVQRAVQRNQARGLSTAYEALEMPAETRNYVPKLQAVKNIVLDAGRYGLTLPKLENHPYFLSVNIQRDIDVAVAARVAGLSVEEFQQLNPQLNKPVILAAGTPQVLLPYDAANRFVRDLPLQRTPLASWTAWVAPKTLKPADAARQVGMSEEHLREVNRIPPRMMVTAGSTLLVPRGTHTTADVSERVADNAAISLTPEPRPLRKVVLKAGKKGESVAALAQRYKVSPAQVAQWNKVAANGHIKPGQPVVLMLPNVGVKTTAKAVAKPSTKATTPRVAPATARATSKGPRSAKAPQAPVKPAAKAPAKNKKAAQR